ncbi:hypothetical protein EOPP23_02305 [Endozoicomonas sp. OPT23]|nr:hypothetical protein [Endozoicomonas sp. OPT23]
MVRAEEPGSYHGRKVLVTRNENNKYQECKVVDQALVKKALKDYGSIKRRKMVWIYINELFKSCSFNKAKKAVIRHRRNKMDGFLKEMKETYEDKRSFAYGHFRDYMERLEINPAKMQGSRYEEYYVPEMVSVLNNVEEKDLYPLRADGSFSPGEDQRKVDYTAAVRDSRRFLTHKMETDALQAAVTLLNEGLVN